ncbi:MAG: GTP-binding protein, partial [Bacteroidota bacterium]|nr:GTP-binding protein [Bacteroidota bacterium]
SKFRELLQDLEKTTDHLLQSFRLGNVIKNGISVAIVGSPNAGKSTLLNALLNEERAIVSEIAGTTRDTIEEVLNVNGILFRLIDTAGIREHAADVIESMGVVRSKEKIRQADIVVFVFDIREVHEEAIFSLRDELKELNKKVIFVANKMDEAPESLMEKTLEIIPESIFISAKYQTRVHTLGESLFELATGDEWSTENVVVTNARHFSALKEVKTSLKSIEEGLDKKISGDLLASDIRRCLHFLGEITGEISNEDLLDYIFSKFCIGK